MTCDHHLNNQICNTEKQVYITFALELVLRELRFMFCPFILCVKTTFWRPPALSNFLCLWTVFNAAHFVMKFHRERTDCSSRLPQDLSVFLQCPASYLLLKYFIWKGIGVTILLCLLVIQMPFCVRSGIFITCYVTLFNDYSSKFYSYSYWLCATSWLVHTFNVQSSMLLTDICFILPLCSLKFNSIVT